MSKKDYDWDIFDDFGLPFSISSRVLPYRLRNYDPQKYELTPRKDYIDTLIKEKEKEIEYHEGKIVELRDEKEKLEKQKQD